MKKIKGIRALIFDYGGTLDTRGRHWSHILWEGFVAAGVPIDKETFLDAYVQAERTLARTPIIAPEDNFHALLLKKADIETKAVCDSGRWEVNEPVRRKAAECIAAGRRMHRRLRLRLRTAGDGTVAARTGTAATAFRYGAGIELLWQYTYHTERL